MKQSTLAIGAATMLLLAGLFFAMTKDLTGPVMEVEAQSSLPFSQTFTVYASNSTQVVPACTTTSPPGCIPNWKQASHEVIVTPASSATCYTVLQGSSDNTNWVSIGASSGASATTVTVANGYFPYIQLSVLACSVNQTISYVGFGTTQATVYSNTNKISASIASVVEIQAFSTPFVITGFQCSNIGNSAAYLELWVSQTVPTLGSGGYFYELPIPQNVLLPYAGPVLQSSTQLLNTGTYNLYAAAVTGAGGSNPVSVPIECNFQANAVGGILPFPNKKY